MNCLGRFLYPQFRYMIVRTYHRNWNGVYFTRRLFNVLQSASNRFRLNVHSGFCWTMWQAITPRPHSDNRTRISFQATQRLNTNIWPGSNGGVILRPFVSTGLQWLLACGERNANELPSLCISLAQFHTQAMSHCTNTIVSHRLFTVSPSHFFPCNPQIYPIVRILHQFKTRMKFYITMVAPFVNIVLY